MAPRSKFINDIAKMANGIADDLATNILLATDKPILIAPAMNVKMWGNEATQRNLRLLKSDGIRFVGPKEGLLACGETGYGRMVEPIEMVRAIEKAVADQKQSPLSGKKILVTSGPTEEPLDPIRFISNRSQGIQGKAIAEALVNVGATVLFVTGPVNGKMPEGAEIVKIRTAEEMLKIVSNSGPYDVAICAAAVSDWQCKKVSIQKMKKEKNLDEYGLYLEKTPDILEHISNFKPRPKLVVGFAAETEQIEKNALNKLNNKKCDWILANDVSLNCGFMGKQDTQITRFSKKGKKLFPQMSKLDFSNLLVKDICAEFE